MPDIDLSDHEISELGPMLKDIEDPEALRELLAAEADGLDRAPVIRLVEDRIEKAETVEEGESRPEAADLTELSVADVANMVRDIDDAETLRTLLEREREGRDRESAVTQIANRIESVEGSEERDEPVETVPPEEKHPELDHPTNEKQWVEGTVDGEYRDMWVYCETQAGELVDVTREMLGHARKLMDGYNREYGGDERVVAVLVGADASDHVEAVVAHGADLVVYHEDERLERFRHTPYTEIVVDMMRAGGGLASEGHESVDWKAYHEPRYTLFPATNNGRDLSALVQGALDSGLASDCSGLYIESEMISNPAKVGTVGDKTEFERVLHMKRPDFSGFEYSTILCIDKPDRDFHPQGASVIPGSFDVPEPEPGREAAVVEYEMSLDEAWFEVEVTDAERLDGGVDLSGHDVVVAVGRGIGDDPTRGIELALDLVDAFEDADLGLSRGVITSSYAFDSHVEDYVAEERQIGESGQVVEPEIYVAAGISGAIQHKVGCDESDTIVAVNTDPEADIRDFSDYFVEGDLFEVLPRLTEAVEAGRLAPVAEASDD